MSDVSVFLVPPPFSMLTKPRICIALECYKRYVRIPNALVFPYHLTTRQHLGAFCTIHLAPARWYTGGMRERPCARLRLSLGAVILALQASQFKTIVMHDGWQMIDDN